MKPFAPLLAAVTFAAAPVMAGVPEVVHEHILPRVAVFADATAALDATARADCTRDAMIPAYHTAYDAWLGVAHLGFGPIEANGRTLAISFWPDKKGMVGATVRRFVAEEDPVVSDPEAFAEVSIAARGLLALEWMLFDDTIPAYGPEDYSCRFVQAISHDLSRMAQAINTEWNDSFAATLLTAGQPENTVYLTEKEAVQALYTQLLAGLIFNADQRLGRPLGTFLSPRPARAEARRSERSLRNIVLSLEALDEMAQKLAGYDIPLTDAGFADAIEKANALDDPALANLEDVQARFETEIVQQRIQAIQGTVANEIGVKLGVSAGFNSSDGD